MSTGAQTPPQRPVAASQTFAQVVSAPYVHWPRSVEKMGRGADVSAGHALARASASRRVADEGASPAESSVQLPVALQVCGVPALH